jgi:manganese oxidase
LKGCTVQTPPEPATQRAEPPASGFPVGATAVIVAATALLIAVVALIMRDDDGTATSTGETATVSLSEFALEPASVEVPAGGSLEVTNDGSADHDLAIRDTDPQSSILSAGDSETLDISSLEPGEYEMYCTIPGHEESGMSGTLTLTEGAATAAAATEGDDAHAGHGDMSAEDLERMDEAMHDSIMAFPAETEGVGNEVLEPEVLSDGTKRFELTAEIAPWEVEPGQVVEAWAYNGMVPGPLIQVDVGDTVEIVLHNELPMGTDLHLHGVKNLANDMDGVAPITQPLIEPGESFTYEFEADEAAVAMYHPHHHGQMKLPNGMLGALLIGDMPLPTGETVGGVELPDDITIAEELPMVLNDSGAIGYSLNGKSFPATEPLTTEVGDWVLVHYFNEGAQIHPMHLHGFEQIVIAKDGFPLDQPFATDTLNVAPGERYTVLFQTDTPGTWVWHCHILSHAERDTGMFGMVTAVIVE